MIIIEMSADKWKAGMSVKMAFQQQLSALRKKDEGIFFLMKYISLYFSQIYRSPETSRRRPSISQQIGWWSCILQMAWFSSYYWWDKTWKVAGKC